MILYQKHILPRLLNFFMGKKVMEKHRLNIIAQAKGVVLEIGFGSGLNLPYYKNIFKLYGLDPSVELNDLAKERVKIFSFSFEYIQASAEKIPLPENSIDTVVSTWTLCSIPNPELALKEICRVLKPDGQFIFIEHGKSPRKIIGVLQKLFTPFSKFFCGGCHLNRGIDKIISNGGFKIENLEIFTELNPLTFMYKGIAKKL